MPCPLDQQGPKLNDLCKPLGMRAETYNGQTSNKLKAELRKDPPEILLTNPEYLNDSFLAWLDRHWTGFLSNLCFLVIDEMHLYHGYFGTNMALLLRRLFVQLDRLGASPKVFLSTATCANPLEHALNLTGRTAGLLQGSKMRPRRHYLFVNPNNRPSHSTPKNRRRNPTGRTHREHDIGNPAARPAGAGIRAVQAFLGSSLYRLETKGEAARHGPRSTRHLFMLICLRKQKREKPEKD